MWPKRDARRERFRNERPPVESLYITIRYTINHTIPLGSIIANTNSRTVWPTARSSPSFKSWRTGSQRRRRGRSQAERRVERHLGRNSIRLPGAKGAVRAIEHQCCKSQWGREGKEGGRERGESASTKLRREDVCFIDGRPQARRSRRPVRR